jgi:hypothetical protein
MRRVAAVIHANRLKPYHDPNAQPIEAPAESDENDNQCLCFDEIPDESFEEVDPNSQPETHFSVQPNLDTDGEPPTTNYTNDDNTSEIQPDIIDIEIENDDDIFQAEKLLKKHVRRGRTSYLVKWYNYIPCKRSNMGTRGKYP